jgi:hypothetical protein
VSRRGRLALALWLIGLPLLSWWADDLYPLSRMPMFSAAPRDAWQLRVLSPDGTELPAWKLGLEVLEPANPEARLGAMPPGLLIGPGPFPPSVLTERVQRHLRQAARAVPYVDVVEERLGPSPRHRGLEVLEQRRLRVMAP